MKKTVYVTRAQKRAAQWLVEDAARTGEPVRDSIVKIANARRADRRDTAATAS